MCDLVLLIVGQSRLRLLDGGIGTSRREPHDDRIAEPIECQAQRRLPRRDEE